MPAVSYKPLGSVEQYLRVYAEPEAALAMHVREHFERAVVVPVFGESADFLDGYLRAFESAAGQTLCIVVVNAARDADPALHAANERCFTELLARMTAPSAITQEPAAWLGRLASAESATLLLVDRQSLGVRLPEKQGVGLARRIGADIALSLHGTGKLKSEWIATSDADVALPADYFAGIERVGGEAVVVAYPFLHVASGAADVDRASMLYETFLRYYVLGLSWAGSPYAFHTVGSTLAIRADAYAAVRGFPKRAAGEDFYLLNKLAKVGALVRPAREPIRIRSRRSARVPFGTGRAVTDLCADFAQGNDMRLYDPRSFTALRAALRCLADFAAYRDLERALGCIDDAGPARGVVATFLERLQVRAVLAESAREAPTELQLYRRLHTWFDAFRTLKLIHALRNEVFPALDWRSALKQAEFCRDLSGDDPEAARDALRLQERELAPVLGPTLPAR